MANEEHLKILNKGVNTWNQWRKNNREIQPDLRRSDLTKAKLNEVDLSRTNLAGADLRRADLRDADLTDAELEDVDLFDVNLCRAKLDSAKLCHADLSYAELCQTSLIRAKLNEADLSGTDLTQADFSAANLVKSNLSSANLSGANLSEADLGGADLTFTNLSEAILIGADLTLTRLFETRLTNARLDGATMSSTMLMGLNLSGVQGLESVKHNSASYISVDTIYLSNGNIPRDFLQGAGIPNGLIEYMHSLKAKDFAFHSCFISYSSKDQEFAERLHADLQSKGVRCWFAPEDLKIGSKLRPSFDEAIRLHDKLLILLSEYSVKSQWVEKEVETAFEKEHQQSRIVLFPIRLDDAVMETKQAWAADIRRMRHIGDFRGWKQRGLYKKSFERLLRNLQIEGTVESAAQG